MKKVTTINKDISALAETLKLLDKRLVEAKTPEDVEKYKKLIKEFEKIFHELETEKVKATA